MSSKRRILPYRDTMEHIADELVRLDQLLRMAVARFRTETGSQHDPAAQQLYIHDREIDRLLEGPKNTPCMPKDEVDALAGIEVTIRARVEAAASCRIFLGLQSLVSLYGLTPLERDIVLICLAPELDPKYRRIYAYLQDDITLQHPAADFMTKLLCTGEFDHWNARPVFSRHSRLLKADILQVVESRDQADWQRRVFRLSGRIAKFILGRNMLDDRLTGICRLLESGDDDGLTADARMAAAEIAWSAEERFRQAGFRRRIVCHFFGPAGGGKLRLAQAVAKKLGAPLVVCDAGLLLLQEHELDDLLNALFREGLLLQAGVCIENLEQLFSDPGRAAGLMKRIMRAVEDSGWLTFLLSERRIPDGLRSEAIVLLSKEVAVPDAASRREVWVQELAGIERALREDWAGLLSSRFRLTPGRIRDSLRDARDAALCAGESDDALLPRILLACREHSNRRLADMSLKIESGRCWDDLVLPETRRALLREICNQVRHRERVYGDWGFGRMFSHGKGLSVLFSGPPGTGKTMAAGVIARELCLDLYKIDLSGVVSKYIGETEKNLSRIFQEAESANAILFFDEADALFGKRTEVSDSHDRYANIEISYLLQKMEEYDGVVILASNLRQNIDDAFVRRIRFIVEFPFPDEESRRRIWQTHFPDAAPVDEEIDFRFLSRSFEVSGGHIRNIVLNAAFLAADNGGAIGMEHILRSVRQEYEKMGTVWNDGILAAAVRGRTSA